MRSTRCAAELDLADGFLPPTLPPSIVRAHVLDMLEHVLHGRRMLLIVFMLVIVVVLACGSHRVGRSVMKLRCTELAAAPPQPQPQHHDAVSQYSMDQNGRNFERSQRYISKAIACQNHVRARPVADGIDMSGWQIFDCHIGAKRMLTTNSVI